MAFTWQENISMAIDYTQEYYVSKMACNSNGMSAVAAEFSDTPKIWVTHDRGVNLVSTGPVPAKFWTCVAMSADGQRIMTAAQFDYMYLSTDGGTNWAKILLAGSFPFNGLAMSDDGMIVYACSGGLVAQRKILKSVNGGTVFTPLAALTTIAYFDIACSEDGQHIIATGSLGTTYSHDGGATWAPKIFGAYACDISDDGTIMYLTEPTVPFTARSDDSGNTFNFLVNPLATTAIKCSPDGQKVFTGRSYSIDKGVTWTQIIDEGGANYLGLGACVNSTFEYVFTAGNFLVGDFIGHFLWGENPLPPVPPAGGVSYSASFASGKSKKRRVNPYIPNDNNV